MWGPTPRSELALRIGVTRERNPMLQLKQLDRCQHLTHQNACAVAWTEDHHGTDAYEQINPSDDAG